MRSTSIRVLPNNAQVNAVRFSNAGQFTFQNTVSPSPYATLNTSFYTNLQSGQMTFDPGVRFELLTKYHQQAGAGV